MNRFYIRVLVYVTFEYEDTLLSLQYETVFAMMCPKDYFKIDVEVVE